MLLKNNSARLIIIRLPDGSEYEVIPGTSAQTEVPNIALQIAFVKQLIESGDLSKTDSIDSNDFNEKQPIGDDERQSLINDLEALEVKVDKRWSIERLKSELEKAQRSGE